MHRTVVISSNWKEAPISSAQLEFAVGKGVSGKIKCHNQAEPSAPPLVLALIHLEYFESIKAGVRLVLQSEVTGVDRLPVSRLQILIEHLTSSLATLPNSREYFVISARFCLW
jgi:hypothetical protein